MERLGVWPPLPPRAFTARKQPLPFPLDDPRCRVFARARQGLWHAIPALGLGRGDSVLVPAYHHGSEIEAWARAGVKCHFYDVGDDLQPDGSVAEIADRTGAKALHLTHFLGLPQDAPRWRSFCDERNMLLVEDVAQAWLGQVDGSPLGSFGDAAIFCLYKSFGVPDGGAVLATGVIPTPEGGGAGWSKAARRTAAWVVGRSSAAARATARLAESDGSFSVEEDIALGDDRSLGAMGATGWLLPHVYRPDAVEKRLRNHRFLAKELGDLVVPPFRDLPQGAAPFAFPIAVGDKRLAHKALGERGIDAQDFWSHPHPSLPAGFPVSERLRATVLALPVHQELRHKDLARMVDSVLEVCH